MESESKKIRRAEKNMKVLFKEIKSQLEKSEDELLSPV